MRACLTSSQPGWPTPHQVSSLRTERGKNFAKKKRSGHPRREKWVVSSTSYSGRSGVFDGHGARALRAGFQPPGDAFWRALSSSARRRRVRAGFSKKEPTRAHRGTSSSPRRLSNAFAQPVCGRCGRSTCPTANPGHAGGGRLRKPAAFPGWSRPA